MFFIFKPLYLLHKNKPSDYPVLSDFETAIIDDVQSDGQTLLVTRLWHINQVCLVLCVINTILAFYHHLFNTNPTASDFFRDHIVGTIAFASLAIISRILWTKEYKLHVQTIYLLSSLKLYVDSLYPTPEQSNEALSLLSWMMDRHTSNDLMSLIAMKFKHDYYHQHKDCNPEFGKMVITGIISEFTAPETWKVNCKLLAPDAYDILADLGSKIRASNTKK